MEKLRMNPASAVTGLILAAAVFLLTTFAADRLLKSELYGRSRLISQIVSQDSVGIADLAADRRNIGLMLKFVGALTSAYIDFELIPVGEAGTFAAVYESIPDGVEVERFEYRRKNLVIFGSADEESYAAFAGGLEETGYFESVSGHRYTSTDDTVRFELECASPHDVNAYHAFG